MLAEFARTFGDDEPGVLRQIYISLSNVCNARCEYCDVHETAPQRGDFTPVDLARVLREAQTLGCTLVHFMGGGEPLISSNFLPAVGVCANLGLGVAVTTNGSHLKQRVGALMEDAPLRLVFLSIDSQHYDRHDAIRRMPGLWRRAMDGLTECRRRFPDARLVINHVLTAQNMDALEDFVRWSGEIGAHAVNIIPVKDMPALKASAAQAARLAGQQAALRAVAVEVGVDLLCDPEDMTSWAIERSGGASPEEYRCVFPQHALYLDLPTGGIFPCDCTVHRKPQERFWLGNLWTTGLEAAWRGERITALRQVLASPCDPGCKAQCDWNNRRSNRVLRAAAGEVTL
jgi:MoaA/NifB/PqqE/SkfB family radical SAM enzyme